MTCELKENKIANQTTRINSDKHKYLKSTAETPIKQKANRNTNRKINTTRKKDNKLWMRKLISIKYLIRYKKSHDITKYYEFITQYSYSVI